MNETRNTVKLDILGNGNPTRVFNDNGDGNIGYSIYNIQRDGQSLFYKKVGIILLIPYNWRGVDKS